MNVDLLPDIYHRQSVRQLTSFASRSPAFVLLGFWSQAIDNTIDSLQQSSLEKLIVSVPNLLDCVLGCAPIMVLMLLLAPSDDVRRLYHIVLLPVALVETSFIISQRYLISRNFDPAAVDLLTEVNRTSLSVICPSSQFNEFQMSAAPYLLALFIIIFLSFRLTDPDDRTTWWSVTLYIVPVLLATTADSRQCRLLMLQIIVVKINEIVCWISFCVTLITYFQNIARCLRMISNLQWRTNWQHVFVAMLLFVVVNIVQSSDVTATSRSTLLAVAEILASPIGLFAIGTILGDISYRICRSMVFISGGLHDFFRLAVLPAILAAECIMMLLTGPEMLAICQLLTGFILPCSLISVLIDILLPLMPLSRSLDQDLQTKKPKHLSVCIMYFVLLVSPIIFGVIVFLLTDEAYLAINASLPSLMAVGSVVSSVIHSLYVSDNRLSGKQSKEDKRVQTINGLFTAHQVVTTAALCDITLTTVVCYILSLYERSLPLVGWWIAFNYAVCIGKTVFFGIATSRELQSSEDVLV